ncbi:MAG: hypothetical protein Q8910_06660, partial [Bacteroidota bacterium]|nr:hypothetical protein [Bacteroidota bacterium]
DTITKSGESYTLTFSDGNRKIVVVTNNISDGTYVITSNNIDSSTEKLATAVYFNAGESYPGQSGTLTLSGAASGNLSGTYSFTSLINTKPVSIEGSFKSVRITEASSTGNNPVTESDSAWVTRVDVIGNSSPVLHFTGKSVTRTSNNQLVFIFTVGTDELKVVTNSTESGTYTICMNGLEPSTAKQACLSYIFNGGDPDGYYAWADTGTFNISVKDGKVSGTFSSDLPYRGKTYFLKDGKFIDLSIKDEKEIIWQSIYGGTGDDEPSCIRQTSDGGFIVAGWTDIGRKRDYAIIKLNARGEKVWTKVYGGSGDDQAYSIEETSDGGYIVAGYTDSYDHDVVGNTGKYYEYWILKLNSGGNIVWQKCLGGAYWEKAFSIKQTKDGGYIVAGESNSVDGQISGGNHGQMDFWVVKLTDTGSISWQKSLGGSQEESAYDIQQTSDGGYIVAGSASSNDKNVSGNHGQTDCWIVKLTATGDISWQKNYGGSLFDVANSILQTTDGGYIFAGYTNSNDGDVSGNHGDNDAWIVKLTAAGAISWQKTVGSTSEEEALSIQKTSDGGYVFSGYTDFPDGVKGNYDIWIVKLNADGQMIGQKTFEGSRGQSIAHSIIQTSDGNYAIATSSAAISGKILGHSQGFNPDWWIVKIFNPF